MVNKDMYGLNYVIHYLGREIYDSNSLIFLLNRHYVSHLLRDKSKTICAPSYMYIHIRLGNRLLKAKVILSIIECAGASLTRLS